MSSGIKAATLIQIGKETSRGSGVAATRKLLLKNATFRIMETYEEFEGQMSGVLGRTAIAPVLVRNGTEFEIATDLDFDQVLLPLLSGVKGGVSPTTPGSGEARLWTFAPSNTADPLPTTYTLEYAERDMDASPNELGYDADYAFTTSFEITGGLDQLPQLSVSMVARKSNLASSTGALSLPAIAFASNMRWGVYFDSAWANLGNTQITGQVYGFSYKWSDFLRPEYFLDNRSTLDFTAYEFKGGRVADLTMDVVLGAASGDLVPTEDALKTAGTARFVRVELTGGAFDAPDNGLARFIRLDGAYFHAPDSMQDRGQDRDGNTITRVHMVSTYDSTSSQDVEMVVQNILTAFP